MILYVFILPTVGVTMTLQHLDNEFYFTTPMTYLLLTNPPNPELKIIPYSPTYKICECY